MRTIPRADEKIVPGPKWGIVFCTYAGIHLGPKETIPALSTLELELEHLKFKVIGSLAVPGNFILVKGDTSKWYHSDIRDRPNEEDMRIVASFVDDTMKKIGETSIA